MFKDFLVSARSLSRNPLGVIALFIGLIYGFAILLLSFSGDSITEAQKWPVIWFVVLFPVVVLFVFYLLVTKHHSKLYSPQDYKDEESFLKTLPLEIQRSRLKSEIDFTRRKYIEETTPNEEDEKTVPDSSEIKKGYDKYWEYNDFLLAEDLALRYIENELGEPIKRQVSIGNRLDLAFDAATIKSNSMYLIEVKLLKGPNPPYEIIDALISRFREAENIVKDKIDGTRSKVKFIMIFVANLNEDDRIITENQIREYITRTSSVDIRVLPFANLKKDFGAVLDDDNGK